MPTIINGCGTWYYGKRRIHRVKAQCSVCHRLGELQSYDTTLYFVVVMIPVLPLGQKRILDKCPACERHRLISLKDWEASKTKSFGEVLEKLRANPDDKETIQSALALATVYQDAEAFDGLASALAGHRTGDAEIQAQLGSAYEYFSRWTDAEAAYARALAITPSDELRERLAVCLLKQGRPEEAVQHVAHVFEQKDPDKAWLSFWLVEGCMAKGLHEQALNLMDLRDATFPQLVNEKAYQKQRQTAEKYKASGKPVPSTYLAESSKAGYSAGSGLGFKWPKYVVAAIVIGLLTLYLGVATYRGQHRTVYLANGWTRPYVAKVNGQEHELQPGSVKQLALSEGDVKVSWPQGSDGDQTVTIQTPFFGRPFFDPVFVINPDQCALFEREQTTYTANPKPTGDPDPEYSTGQLLHEFPGVDLEFQPFPPQVQAEKGSRVQKTRVGIIPTMDTRDRFDKVVATASKKQQVEYGKRFVQLDPDDEFALGWLVMRMTPEEALAFLKPQLADRPIRVEWHRYHQTMTERASPDTNLTPEYERLVQDTNRAPDAVYLLGRLDDGPAGEKLYEEAAAAHPPSAYACSAIGYRRLVRGDLQGALEWSKRGIELAPAGLLRRSGYLQALQAAGKHRELLTEASKDSPNGQLLRLHDRLATHLALNDEAGAEAELTELMRRFGAHPGDPVVAQLRANLDGLMALAKRDREKYVALVKQSAVKDEFAVALLTGDFKAAASAQAVTTSGTQPWEADASHAALLYLAGLKANDAAFADEQWKKLGEAFSHGDREAKRLAKMMADQQPFDANWLVNCLLRPQLKRVVLWSFARKYPDNAAALTDLAKKLDYEHDSTSLCLCYVTDQ